MNALASLRELDRAGDDRNWSTLSTAIKIFVALAIGIGVLARWLPFTDLEGRLYWQYMTEDGYLMQTIARNMAIGLGMTTAEGTIATNGVQPLATFIFAGLHFFAGGSKLGAVVLVSIVSSIAGVLAAYFLYRIGRLVLRALPNGHELAALAAALWFAAPLIVPISMNGLETSVYWATLLGTCANYLTATQAESWSFGWRQRIVLGVLLGLTFLARNDAVFFIAILLFVHLIVGGAALGGGYARRLVDCIVAGIVSMVIASPWLIYNYRLFGSVVPISGTAQSYDTALGANLQLIPAKLFEASALFVPLPGKFEKMLPTMLVALAVVVIAFVGFWSFVAKRDTTARRFLWIGAGLVACLSAYYGLAFGAPHFLARYLSILSPFLWLATLTTAFCLLGALLADWARYATYAATALLIVIAAGIAGTTFVRAYSDGTAHMHKQVVEWVAANVPEQTWVGAPQTGTLGYFHDRTLNLDGKVNPGALRVLLEEGHILNYAVDSKVDYIVDWVGMADWVKRRDLSARFADEFQVVVRDEEHNLAALKRIHPASQ